MWARIALLSFGGPAGQIAVMHRILVEEKRWIGEERFLHALNYCMLLPGPEAQQLATYIGWLLHKTKGGLIAGTLFVLPGFVAILALSYAYALLGNVPLIEGLFFGLKAAVLASWSQAVVRLGARALRNRVMLGLAAAAFLAIFVLDAPFPAIVAAAGLAGYFGGRAGLAAFQGGGGHAVPDSADCRPRHRTWRAAARACAAQPGLVAAGRRTAAATVAGPGGRRCSSRSGPTMCSAGSPSSSARWRW